jgi:ATP adenylyltransferase
MFKPNPYSHITAKERDTPSFPTKWLLKNGFLSGKILDFGCGFGIDVKFLLENKLEVSGYDKFYFKDYPENEKFDSIVCNYVLNVLMPEEQADVLMQVSELLKPDGKAYFTVRRDLTYEGFRTHKLHKVPTYQCNVILPYKSIFKNDSCEIYEFQHFNYSIKKDSCPFCSPAKQRPIVTETATAYAIYDKYPVSPGHALIIPKRHTKNYFELNHKEQFALWLVVNRMKQIVEKEFKPDGFNIGFNTNEAAGQTVFHTHIHLIPRYKGDVKNPRGGVRNVVPGKGGY